MSFSDFDLSQFYTRRNSNYNIGAEGNDDGQPSGTSDTGNKGDNESEEVATLLATDNDENHADYCGFLFSASRDEGGEYWPIRMGINTIGSGNDDDVILSQKSVIEEHAVLSAERKNGKLVMKIKGNGYTLLNGADIIGETPCRDKDIITIGNVYQLLVLFVDKEKYGLKKADDFEEKNLTEEEPIGENSSPQEEGTVFLQ